VISFDKIANAIWSLKDCEEEGGGIGKVLWNRAYGSRDFNKGPNGSGLLEVRAFHRICSTVSNISYLAQTRLNSTTSSFLLRTWNSTFQKIRQRKNSLQSETIFAKHSEKIAACLLYHRRLKIGVRKGPIWCLPTGPGSL